MKGRGTRRVGLVVVALLVIGGGAYSGFRLWQSGHDACLKKPIRVKNVIIVMSDALRADRLGCYGYHRSTSPVIDDLAARGIFFKNAYSQAPWTAPSVASLFTSLYPRAHRTGHPRSRSGYLVHLGESYVTLAEVLAEHGYKTGAIANNPAISGSIGFGQGFDSYDNNEVIPPDKPTEPTYQEVIEWLQGNADERFFFFWHIIDPHWPYCPPPEFDLFTSSSYEGKYNKCLSSSKASDYAGARAFPEGRKDIRRINGLYDGDIRYMDFQVGKLLEALEKMGLSSETLLVFVSDHGESFFEHGHFGHAIPMYEENLHIPLIIYPGRDVECTVENSVEMVDVFPTVLEILGVKRPASVQGKSLMPLIEKGKGEWADKLVYAEGPQSVERKSIKSRRFKLIWGPKGVTLNDSFASPGKKGGKRFLDVEKKLYDFEDRGERLNVIEQHPEMADKMMGLLRARLKKSRRLASNFSRFVKMVGFNRDWRQDAHRVWGEVVYKSGRLFLRDNSSGVIWKVNLPSPLKDGKIAFEYHAPRNQQSGSLFALSKNGKKWISLPAREAEWLERENTYQFEDSLKRFAGARTLYIKYRNKGLRKSGLRSFVVEADLVQESFEMPQKTQENLEALGYVH